jgi:adenine-specific DNA-methyltransferase
MLDAFSGMCAVGTAVGVDRHIWSNDAQNFAAAVAGAMFTSATNPPAAEDVKRLLLDSFHAHLRTLGGAFTRYLADEEWLLRVGSLELIQLYAPRSLSAVVGGNRLQRNLGALGRLSPTHQLFSLTYSGTYFSLRQCVAIDSIIQSVDQQVLSSRLSSEGKRWLMIALGRVLKDVATTTGHFAQYLEPNPNNFLKFLQQRRRDVWSEFLNAVDQLEVVGDPTWRRGNRAFCGDSLELLEHFHNTPLRPAVVYADPPYTDDQYSRFYHVLESLMLYDYPDTTAKARYRPDRFRSSFSVKSEVEFSFRRLAGACFRMGADLILSYPTNGLLHQAGSSPDEILREFYGDVDIRQHRAHEHSTFGASKGSVKSSVVETIYYAAV